VNNRKTAWLVAVLAAALYEPAAAQSPPVATSAQSTNTAEQTAAQDAANTYLVRLDEGDLGDLYESMTAGYRTLVSKPMFLQRAGFLRLQSGGRALARELVGSQAFTQTPTGQTGNYYYVRFRTRHPNGLVFQDVYLEKVGSAWVVADYYAYPAPQQ
jgi:Protein of unknown function (DUF4019)